MSLLRNRAEGHARVGYAELLFDLVFVYAVTQLSHTLLQDLSMAGVARSGLLFLAVWWAWNYTAWVTNWLNPERHGVRLMLFGLMGAGLVLSMSIPHAFQGAGLAFAFAYVAMQLGRSLFMWGALRHASPDNAANFLRISIWFAVSGCFWLVGGWESSSRLPLWAVAALLDYAAPLLGFRVPALGRSVTSSWDVESSHLSERCALFIIIVLGEVILMMGVTYADHANETAPTIALAAAFVATLALWWLYFAAAADRASSQFAAAADVGAVARSAYTYLHMPIVAGVIAFAAGVQRLILHPTGHPERATAALLAGGPLLYLAGLAGFRLATRISVAASHWVLLLCLAAIIASADRLSSVAAADLVTMGLVVLAFVESRADEQQHEGMTHAAR